MNIDEKYNQIAKTIENNEDIESIREMISDLDVNHVYYEINESNNYKYETCLLNVTAENLNYDATKLLFELGANPNTCEPECPLRNIRYLDKGDWKKKYQIAKLFFEHGADPNFEFDDCESMYDDVFFSVFNDLPESDDDFYYLINLFKLLIVYGGGSENTHYPKLDTSKVEMDKIDEYKFYFVKCEDGKYLKGILVDKEGKEIVNI